MSKIRKAHYFERLKAGIVDMFMIGMPIQYFTTYFIAGSAAEYRESQPLVAAAGGAYLLIIALFLTISGQTPGYRYQRLHLRSANGQRASFVQVLIRLVVWLLSFAVAIGWILPLLRKDRAFLHDMASGCVLLKDLREETTASQNRGDQTKRTGAQNRRNKKNK